MRTEKVCAVKILSFAKDVDIVRYREICVHFFKIENAVYAGLCVVYTRYIDFYPENEI